MNETSRPLAAFLLTAGAVAATAVGCGGNAATGATSSGLATTWLGEEDDDRDALEATLKWEVKLAMRVTDARDQEPRSKRMLFYTE